MRWRKIRTEKWVDYRVSVEGFDLHIMQRVNQKNATWCIHRLNDFPIMGMGNSVSACKSEILKKLKMLNSPI
jgi:hypothetical protein